MAGHSQFKNIMHRKGAQDKKRSKLFSKLAKEVTVAAKLGGVDPNANPRLRAAVAAAKSASMPKDNIERAIKRSQGGDEDNYEELRYEGFGPGGVAFIVEALSDNRNRTASDVRTIFSRAGGNLGETGSVNFMFDRVGEITYKPEAGDADTVFEAALEAGADNVESDDNGHVIYTEASDLHEVAKTLEDRLGEADSTKLIWRPQTLVKLDEDGARSLMKLLDMLDDNDDVQTVYGNYEVDDEVAALLEG